MQEYFAILMGNDLCLANTELQALVDYIDEDVGNIPMQRLVTFKTNKCPVEFVRQRAALVREIGYVIYDENVEGTMSDSISKDLVGQYISRNETFSVRVKNFANREQTNSLEVEKRVGGVIQKLTGAPVSLENPDVRFLMINDGSRQFLGVSKASLTRQRIEMLTPHTRAFFHPSLMNTSLARAMCNIAKIDESSLVLDPFCGAGGILSEASVLASSVVGIDRNWGLLSGANKNLRDLKIHNFNLIQGDARRLPMEYCDCIVTDPPYGRTSSTRGSEATILVRSFLNSVMKKGIIKKSLCICGSEEMGVPQMIRNMGLEIRYHVRSRVHSSLTREIVCVEF